MSDLVLQSRAGAVATLTLNNPDKANVLSMAMMDALEAALNLAAADPAVHVVVLAAAGRLFCAGHDLQELTARAASHEVEALFQRCTRLMATIRALPKPVIAKVQGAAVAAGCQLVSVCDLAYAADTAKFGLNGINLGLFCSTPAVPVSRAMAPRQALELALTGNLILAPRAVELGLINSAVPASTLDETVAGVAGKIAAQDPAAIALGKKNFWAQRALDEPAAYALAAKAMADNMDLASTREKINAFIHKA
jgi:enoyl-CoA hydratase/carnithine racemase